MKFGIVLIMSMVSFVFLQAQNLRIEMDELLKDLSKYKIVDVRDNDIYESGHIKDAISFPIKLTYNNQTKNGKITSPDKMQGILRKKGLDINDKIVIYGQGSFFDSARLFWALEVYGFKDIKLLNGGFNEWESLKYPISFDRKKIKKSNYITTINNKRLATKFTTQIASKNPMQTIIDARHLEAYEGKQSSAKRFGHIPSARHIPASHNVSSNNSKAKLKDITKLRQVYEKIDKKQKVVIYCAMGRISATNYFALRELEYDVANYDASWNEWGNDFSLPITNPSSKDK